VPSIEDFTQELYQGKREISVPKDKVTELSPGWYVSKYNLPHKGSKGSWRNGRLHAHDMGDHYSVHLDRVDPKEKALSHLIEDAPLMLFLWTGFRGGLSMVMDKDQLATAEKTLKPMFLIGLILLGIGFLIALGQAFALGIIVLAAIVGLLGLGAFFTWQGVSRRHEKGAWLNFVIAIIAFTFGIVIIYYPKFALALLVFAMVVWTLASGIFLVFGRGDKLLFDQGSIVPIIMGIISLALGLFLLFSPDKGLSLIIALGGLLLIFIGVMQLVSAFAILRSVRKNKRTMTE
jgi:uncharacterized membrane protein HdeD (DUF308 family)